MCLLKLLAVIVLVLEGYHVDAQSRHEANNCGKLGGKCVETNKLCSENWPLETQPGAPYCKNSKLRCCYPVPTAVQCIEKSGFCVINVNTCKGTVEFLFNSNNDKCHCCVPKGKAIISVDEFISKFNKTYENEAETTKRIAIFEDNVEVMKEHNKLYESGESSYQMGVNEFSDLTYDEVIRDLTGDIQNNITSELRAANVYVPENIGNEPESLDYRKMGAINPIRHQGTCGSCWAFSAVSSIESQIFLQNGQLVQLSEQYLVDCSKGVGFPSYPGWTGCQGGWKDGAIEYISNNGIAYGATYPYTERGGTCNQDAPKTSYRVIGIQRVNSGKESELLNALVNRGPIAVSMFVTNNFQNYKEGIFEDKLCHGVVSTNHAMALVGYGKENGKDYWLIRNSWGDGWGEKGYMKLSRDINNHCLISKTPYIPVTEAECDPACVNGDCTSQNTCNCNEGWSADICNEAVCDSECVNGDCTAPNTCTCDEGWSGETCNEVSTGCPVEDGFLKFSGQYFKYLNRDDGYPQSNMATAAARCEKLNLTLAHPNDIIGTRSCLLEVWDYATSWLNIKKIDGVFTWQDDNTTLRDDSSLFRYNNNGDKDCVIILAKQQHLISTPNKPLARQHCSTRRFLTLCQKP